MRTLLFQASIFAIGTSLLGCDGFLGTQERSDTGPLRDTGLATPSDAFIAPGADAYTAAADAFIAPGTDAYTAPPDAFVGPGTDAYTARPDAFVGPDAYVPSVGGPCRLGAPLAEPIAGCRPTLPPSTGDAHEDCARRINQFRCECQHLQPLMRDRAGEGCADMMARYDFEHGMTPHAGFSARICPGGNGQNECPGWGSIESTVQGCLQQMWDEGPGDFYGPPPHGHYINMSSTSFSAVSCGFYVTPTGSTWAVQNFH